MNCLDVIRFFIDEEKYFMNMGSQFFYSCNLRLSDIENVVGMLKNKSWSWRFSTMEKRKGLDIIIGIE